VQGRWSIYI